MSSKAENEYLTGLFNHLGVKKLGGGEVNETFLFKSVVIHLTPVIDIPNADVAVVLNRWCYPEKPDKLSELQASLQGVPGLKVPKVYQTGRIHYRGRETPYWIEDLVEGKTLLKETLEGANLPTYENILKWLAEFHNNYRRESLLRDYYHQRLTSLAKLVQVDGGIGTLLSEDRSENLVRQIEVMQTEVDKCVGNTEVVTTIHGDLRGDNVIINTGTIGVIDFEQGVNGGDWFADIQKLLILGSNDLPDSSRPFRYRPPLNSNAKQKLLAAYLSGRQNNDSVNWVTNDLMDPESDRVLLRQKLFSLDNSLSMVGMKYYLGLANQIAGIGQIDTKAILHRIDVMEGELK